MPIPQVTDRIKEAPALALRALFAGVGQVLLAAEKVRTRALDQLAQIERSRSTLVQAPASRGSAARGDGRPAPVPAAVAGTASTAPASPPGAAEAPHSAVEASDAGAGISGGRAEAQPAPPKRPATKPRATPKPADGKRPGAKPRAPGKPAPTAVPAKKPPAAVQPTSKVPPIPNYDDLSVASLRARLRVLDAETLRAMIAYEKAHAHRADVITMFERRLAKMGDEGS